MFMRTRQLAARLPLLCCLNNSCLVRLLTPAVASCCQLLPQASCAAEADQLAVATMAMAASSHSVTLVLVVSSTQPAEVAGLGGPGRVCVLAVMGCSRDGCDHTPSGWWEVAWLAGSTACLRSQQFVQWVTQLSLAACSGEANMRH
jgi:hypothetical protein